MVGAVMMAAGLAIGAGATVHGADTHAPSPRLVSPNTFAQQQAVFSQAPTVVWSSAVGAGKSYGVCLNELAACSIPGVPCALTRFELASMRNTTIETLRKLVGEELWQGRRRDGSGWHDGETTLFFPKVRCDDGLVRQSKIVCFGWKEPGRALSAEFARVGVDQAEQIEREHFSIAETRLRFYDPWIEAKMLEAGLRPRQMLLICNADYDEHWINLDFEVEAKGMRIERDAEGEPLYEVVLSQSNDNRENLTDDYRKRLGTLEGTIWGERLVHGRWARAEGLVYGGIYDPTVHVIDPPTEAARWGGFPRPDRPRYRAFDWGINHPFTVAWYADYDGVLHCYREGYHTGRRGSEWADWVLEQEALEVEALQRSLEGEEEARAYGPYLKGLNVTESWSDHDLEWRHELSAKGVWTSKANKDIGAGIRQLSLALLERRLVYWRNMLVEPDPKLQREKLPTTVLQEYGRYHWPKRRAANIESSDQKTDLPVDRDNHGLDRDRYMVASHATVSVPGVW